MRNADRSCTQESESQGEQEKEAQELKKSRSTVSDAAGLNCTTEEGNSTCTNSLALFKDSPLHHKNGFLPTHKLANLSAATQSILNTSCHNNMRTQHNTNHRGKNNKHQQHTNKQTRSKVKQPLLATAAVNFVILEDDGIPPSRLTGCQLSHLPKVQTSTTLNNKHHNK